MGATGTVVTSRMIRLTRAPPVLSSLTGRLLGKGFRRARVSKRGWDLAGRDDLSSYGFRCVRE
jgi:hypothetical protein